MRIRKITILGVRIRNIKIERVRIINIKTVGVENNEYKNSRSGG